MTAEDRTRILAFLRTHRWAIEATIAPDGGPQAALIGFGVTDQSEFVFDTLKSTRKAAYFAAFPDGPERLAWPGITYVRVMPTWMRYCDYTKTPPEIVEWTITAQ